MLNHHRVNMLLLLLSLSSFAWFWLTENHYVPDWGQFRCIGFDRLCVVRMKSFLHPLMIANSNQEAGVFACFKMGGSPLPSNASAADLLVEELVQT